MSERNNGTPFFVNDDGSIVNIKMAFETGTHSQFSLHVCRREDWGWELRSQIYVLRSVEHGSIEGLWDDYTSSLVIEKRKKGIPCTRAGSEVKYKRREVPDIKEVKSLIGEHAEKTDSPQAKELLENWEITLTKLIRVIAKEKYDLEKAEEEHEAAVAVD